MIINKSHLVNSRHKKFDQSSNPEPLRSPDLWWELCAGSDMVPSDEAEDVYWLHTILLATIPFWQSSTFLDSLQEGIA